RFKSVIVGSLLGAGISIYAWAPMFGKLRRNGLAETIQNARPNDENEVSKKEVSDKHTPAQNK
ncbi:10078_t:CDS:2, partial [Acaulospora morrowiae]